MNNMCAQESAFADIAGCLCDTFNDCRAPLCWCGLYPGALPAFEYCGSCNSGRCGGGYVNMVGAIADESLISGMGTPCVGGITLLGRAGVLRCMPIGGSDGSPPEPYELSDTALQLIDDMMLIRKALICCYSGDLTLGTYEALPAEGGCVGGHWNFQIRWD